MQNSIQNSIQDILQSLELYFIYIYPGFITIFVYLFTKAQRLKEKKYVIIISVIISYVYVVIYRWIRNYDKLSQFTVKDHVIILAISILVPIIWHRISLSKCLECFFREIKINTTIETNVWDYIHSRDREGKGIVLKVFLDDNIMYEGSLRYHESDVSKKQTICLSGYRRYEKKDGRYITCRDYNNDNSRWVMLAMSDVTRVEIKYSSDK